MAISNKILRIRNHTIPMDNLWVANVETEDNTSGMPKNSTKESESAGSIAPLIEINGYKFKPDEIDYMELDETDFIPYIKVGVADHTGVFTNKHYPQSKCILKLYIKSPNASLKAVRSDFIITDITKTGNIFNDGEQLGMGFTYSISGILNVPKLYNYTTSSINESSYDALLEISKITGLGFATNEISTNDKMCWIQPNISYDDFIGKITERAYKDDSSFFESFIDRYYNLTFLNVANMTADLKTDDAAFDSVSYFKDDIINSANKSTDSTVKSNDSKTTLQLSNFIGFKGTINHIKSYSLDTHQGNALIDTPNKKNVYYYDIQMPENDRFVKYYVKPVRSSFVSDEEISKNETNTWEGLETGNVHDNYIFSKTNNEQNLMDLKKTTLNVVTEGVNLNILRGMRIPLLIVSFPEIRNTYQQSDTESHEGEKEDDKSEVTVDVNLTGYYIVSGMKIIYNNSTSDTINPFTTKIYFVRNNWSKNEEVNGIDNNKQ